MSTSEKKRQIVSTARSVPQRRADYMMTVLMALLIDYNEFGMLKPAGPHIHALMELVYQHSTGGKQKARKRMLN